MVLHLQSENALMKEICLENERQLLLHVGKEVVYDECDRVLPAVENDIWFAARKVEFLKKLTSFEVNEFFATKGLSGMLMQEDYCVLDKVFEFISIFIDCASCITKEAPRPKGIQYNQICCDVSQSTEAMKNVAVPVLRTMLKI